MTNALLLAVLQALVVALGAPLVVGTLRTLKARLVGRFAPKANPEYQFAPGDTELSTVIATDSPSFMNEGMFPVLVIVQRRIYQEHKRYANST